MKGFRVNVYPGFLKAFYTGYILCIYPVYNVESRSSPLSTWPTFLYSVLRVGAIHEAKNSCLLHLARYSYNYTIFQKSEWRFFDKGSIDVKSVLTFEKWPPVAELKLKVSRNQKIRPFWISTLPLEVTLKM